MHFLKPAVGCTVLADIKRQIVFVYGTLLIEIILPDEAALLAVFRNRRLSQKIPVLVYRIQVKNKDAILLQILVHTRKHLAQIRFLQNVIHGIADRHHRAHASVQFQFTHILEQIENSPIGQFVGLIRFIRLIRLVRLIRFFRFIRLAQFCIFFRLIGFGSFVPCFCRTPRIRLILCLACDLKHLLGIVHADHIVPCRRQQPGHFSGAATQFRNRSAADAVFPEQPRKIGTPFLIGNIIHKQIIHSRKALVCTHIVLTFSSASMRNISM